MVDITMALIFLVAFAIFIFVEDKKRKDKKKEDTFWDKTETEVKLLEFRTMKAAYMKTQNYFAKRRKALARDNYECLICGSKHSLEMHHVKGYDQIPFEPIDCMVTLCRTCHQHQHDELGYPKSVEEYYSWDVKLITR